MKGSNSLRSHYGESSMSRADKMSGVLKGWLNKPKSRKRFYNKKRRMFLNNPLFNDKI